MKKYGWLSYLIIATIIGLAVWGTHTKTVTLRKNHLVVCARIRSIVESKGSHVSFEFPFNGKIITDNYGTCTDKTAGKFYRGELYYILLVVSKDNPLVNNFLEDYEDFEKYNITTQDTLGVLCTPLYTPVDH